MDIDAATVTPLAVGQKLLLRWPLLILSSLAGGLLGVLFAAARPPVYQADAVLAISIDYGRTAPLELIVEDRALNRAWQLITSDAVLLEVGADLRGEFGQSEAWEDLQALRKSLRLEQQLSDWHLIARDPSASVAASMANTWADVAMEHLEEAYAHAWRAVTLQGSQFSVSCFDLVQPATLQSVSECLAYGPTLEQGRVADLVEEIRASHGILPAMSFERLSKAEIPSKPALWDRGALVLAGMAIGLIAGALIGVWRPAGILRSDPRPGGRPAQTATDRE